MVHNKELGLLLSLLNLYGPNECKEQFWDNIFALRCLQIDGLIIGGI